MNLMQYVKDILKIVALWMLTTGLIVQLLMQAYWRACFPAVCSKA